MVRLAGEIANGAVWANAARSHMQQSLSYLPSAARGDGFFLGNMIPTCISEDRDAAAALMRKALTGYVMLPNYQNYWIEAGYEEEMRAIQRALAAGEHDKIPSLMSDEWLADCTLYGSVAQVREGVEAWYAAGVTTPILVPSSTKGGQMQALRELLEGFGR
jgi:alkanesulfonate monooxygenase SsuD/methylene tetrahydromethanopterin reductase-like flavin-dependent oxidoreductase (luciferase family)